MMVNVILKKSFFVKLSSNDAHFKFISITVNFTKYLQKENFVALLNDYIYLFFIATEILVIFKTVF